jgi:glycosyltransferase involved in cell wall biosynthesis
MQVRAQISRLDLGDYVSVDGPIYGEAKDEFLRRAEAYIHSSQWESYGVALVEALERGVPSVVSGSVHIAPALLDAGAAIVSDIVPGALESAIARAEHERSRLSSRATAFVGNALNWERVTEAWNMAIRDLLDHPSSQPSVLSEKPQL